MPSRGCRQRTWGLLWGWLTLLAGVFWTNWWVGAYLTRSSSFAHDPHNPIYRVLTPGALIALIGSGLAVIVAGVVVVALSYRRSGVA
jgi:hypothetical protein